MDADASTEQLADLDRISPTSAVLNPDGSLDVELAVPGYDETQEIHIDGTKTLLWLSGLVPQVVDLDGSDKISSEARRVLDQHLGVLRDRMRRRLVAAREALARQMGSDHVCADSQSRHPA